MSDAKSPSREDTHIRLTEFLPFRLETLAETAGASFSHLCSDAYGISAFEWRALASLCEFGHMTSAAISRHARMHKTKVSRALSGLESKGLVERTPSNEDMREAIVALSPEGMELCKAIAPEARRQATGLTKKLSKADQAALWRIIAALDESGGNGDN